MRAFRVRLRNSQGKVIKHRYYLGVDSFLSHGIETFNRYNNYIEWNYDIRNLPPEKRKCSGEICEKIDNKWVKLSDESISELLSDNNIVVDSSWLISKGFKEHRTLLMKTFTKSISSYEDVFKVISVCIDPGNVYVYIREGERDEPPHQNDVVTVFNGDLRGPLKKEFIESLYNLLTGKKL